MTDSEKSVVILNTREELTGLIEESITTPDRPTADLVVTLHEDPAPQPKKGVFQPFLVSSLVVVETQNHRKNAQVEVQQHTAKGQLDLDKNPLEWWKQRRVVFPYLSQLVRRLHCIIATSCPSERCFSAAGNLASVKMKLLATKECGQNAFCL